MPGSNKQIRTLADLTPDNQNANRGTERGDGLLETSIERYGLGRSIVTDRNGVILAGNKTAQKAGELGLENVEVVHTSGDRLVVVVRDDLEHGSAQATGLALADNRVGQVNYDLDLEALAAVQATYPEEVEAFWFDGEVSSEEWSAAFGGLPDGEKAPFRQMTFTVHDSQFERIEAVLKQVKREQDFTDTPNENSNGNALAYLCDVYRERYSPTPIG